MRKTGNRPPSYSPAHWSVKERAGRCKTPPGSDQTATWKDHALTAAIVGYTNAGKSTLLNRLTGAGILAEDKLFATLDPTTRSFTLGDGQQILLTDTVGFINKLPHHLVEAFKSTLEEARYSDIVLHVVDCSNPQMDMHMHVVKETLRELGITDKTIVTVFNKTDRLEESGLPIPRDFSADYQVRISAKNGDGLKELEEILGNIIRSRRVYLERPILIPRQESCRPSANMDSCFQKNIQKRGSK